ncbi:hypothetical protein [Kitasatospora griseola]|uniref:hypothetical protein n=1 Tax=Kitasatospora griseola TaxID=2064 RepID=UPI00341513DD
MAALRRFGLNIPRGQSIPMVNMNALGRLLREGATVILDQANVAAALSGRPVVLTDAEAVVGPAHRGAERARPALHRAHPDQSRPYAPTVAPELLRTAGPIRRDDHPGARPACHLPRSTSAPDGL